jgi:hypothetical protein
VCVCVCVCVLLVWLHSCCFNLIEFQLFRLKKVISVMCILQLD